jgi:hypothetical protein
VKKVLPYIVIVLAFLILVVVINSGFIVPSFKNFLSDATLPGPTTYYVSPSGDDGNSGTSADQSWKTITKADSAVLEPGDSILFEQGGTYYGALTVTASGTATDPITIGAYGSGAAPDITGFTTLSQFTSLGNNIYEANCSQCGSAINMVTVNGQD